MPLRPRRWRLALRLSAALLIVVGTAGRRPAFASAAVPAAVQSDTSRPPLPKPSPPAVTRLAKGTPLGVPVDPGRFDPAGHLRRTHPEFRARFLEMVTALAARGVRLRVTDGMRTIEEQDKLYEKGRHLKDGKWVCDKPKCRGKVTSVKGGFSNHNYGMAVDSYPLVDGVFHNPGNVPSSVWKRYQDLQNQIGQEAERVGLAWGGRWKDPYDPPHVQLLRQELFPTQECRRIFLESGLKGVWEAATRRLR